MVKIQVRNPNRELISIQPALADKEINGTFKKIILWVGRLLSMLSMRYSQAPMGGSAKVAQVFRASINEAVTLSRVCKEHGDCERAHEALYEIANNLSWLNKSQIDALAQQMTLRPDAVENSDLLATFKRGGMIANLPAIKRAIQDLITRFEGKMKEAMPEFVEIEAPTIFNDDVMEGEAPEEPVRRSRRQRAPRVDSEAMKIAKLCMASPDDRHTHETHIPPSLTTEKLSVAEFRLHLEVKAPRLPDFTAVKALSERLDHADSEAVQRMIGSLSLMARLYLYEVSSKHEKLLLDTVVNNYNEMKPTGKQTAQEQQQVFRAYVTFYQRSPCVNGKYVALLERLTA